MNNKKKDFHRLTIDLEPAIYAKLKKLADIENRTASREAKVLLTKVLLGKDALPLQRIRG